MNDQKPLGQLARQLLKELRGNPAALRNIQDTVAHYGPDPAPALLRDIVASPEALAKPLSAVYLAYIGRPAIPHLVELLGHESYEVAKFAACSLASIEGSLPSLVEALRSPRQSVRHHAAGAIQFLGPDAKSAIPALCDMMSKDAHDVETSGVAAGALGKIGKAAIPALRDLLDSSDPFLRVAAVSALWRIGRPALRTLKAARAREQDPQVLAAIDRITADISR